LNLGPTKVESVSELVMGTSSFRMVGIWTPFYPFRKRVIRSNEARVLGFGRGRNENLSKNAMKKETITNKNERRYGCVE